jgi:replicative DNA helicase
LAGLQGRGKSTVSGNLARLVAAGGTPTLAINLEDSRDNLLRRLAAAESRMALAAVERLHNGLDASQKDIILAGMERLKALPITVDSETRDLSAIVARIRTAARNGVKFVVLDQASWVRVEDATTEYEQATPVSEALTIAAHTLHVTILLNVQINRSGAAAHSAQKRLELHHLRASGRYEADADGVLIIQNATGDGPDKTLELDVLKHRHGPSRKTCTLLWTPCQALVTTAQGHEQAADVQAPRSQTVAITADDILADMGDEAYTLTELHKHVADCLGLKSRGSTYSGAGKALFDQVKARLEQSPKGAFRVKGAKDGQQCPV